MSRFYLDTVRPRKKYGGININPANRGKFTATMKHTGKSAEELSHSSNPLTRKWNHKENGGTIQFPNLFLDTMIPRLVSSINIANPQEYFDSVQPQHNYIYPKGFNESDFKSQEKRYTVNPGDSMWRVATQHGLTVDQLRQLNPNIKNDLIHPNDELVYSRKEAKQIHNLKDEWNKESRFNRDNKTAIMNAPHNSNYALIDKENHRLTIFDKDNNILYTTNNISTGESGNDYNTITKADLSEKMNMSTPAGISQITSTGTYHGAPSFQRNRNYSNDPKDAIASSIHIGNTKDSKASNGCVRIGNKQTLEEMSKYLGAGNMVYTLPSKPGSRFTLADGKLNFTADNPYGNDDPNNKRRFWDDYNVVTDTSYNPLLISMSDAVPIDERNNAQNYIKGLVNNKQQFQKDLGISSDLYNKLANLSLGIAQQETKFGTSDRYKLKGILGDSVLNLLRGNTNRSRGITQIKINGDNAELRRLYKKYNINENTLQDPSIAAKATLLRLYHMYKYEGSKYTGANNKPIDRLDAILYKWMGQNYKLANHTATPETNEYINNVKKYANMFNMYSVY